MRAVPCFVGLCCHRSCVLPSRVIVVSVTAACSRRGALSLLGDFHGVAIVGDWPVFATSQLARQRACQAAHTLHQRVADRSGEILAPFRVGDPLSRPQLMRISARRDPLSRVMLSA